MLVFGGQSSSLAWARLYIPTLIVCEHLISETWTVCLHYPSLKPESASKLEKFMHFPCLNISLQKCRDFFQGELVQFKVYLKSQFDTDRAPISNDPEFREFDTVEIIDRIGEGDSDPSLKKIHSNILPAITKQTPLLEDLGLDVNPPSYHHQHTKKLMDFTVFGGLFARWIPRLPRLKHLEFGPGLMKDNGALIRLHCPLFKGLRLTNWYKRIKSVRFASLFPTRNPR